MPSRPPVRDPRQRRLWNRWQSLPLVLRDGAGGVLLFALSLLPLGIPGVEFGELHRSVAPWVPPLLVAGQTLTLAMRRVRPATGLAIVSISFGAAQLTGASTGIAGLALFAAIYSSAAYQRRYRRWVSVAGVGSYVLLAAALHAAGSPERPLDWATFFLVLLTPWFVGLLVRRRIAEQADREAAAAEEAVRAARSLLARDLHDIVTHHVTAMVVQADSAAYLPDSDVHERTHTFEAIGSTGRRALQELRALLGALEQTPRTPGSREAPRETVPGTVANLVAEAQQRGYPVTLEASAPPMVVSDEVAVTLYRIAQEALTNAMKHAPGAAVTMRLTKAQGRVVLRIVNPTEAPHPAPAGRGRSNMADRAALLGGQLDVRVIDGHFELIATIPPEARTPTERRP